MSRLAFLGTPADAVPSLRALVGGGHEIVTVITRPDRRRGRGATVEPSPVKAAATDLGLPVVDRLAEGVDAALAGGAELGVVVAYGRIIPADVLARLPMVNVHFSLLPRWRGAAPVERAVLAGDRETGVCIMAVEAGLDTGPVYARQVVPIGDDDVPTLRALLAEVGARLLVRVLSQGAAGLPTPEPQVGPATYADKVEPGELQLQWQAPAGQLVRVVRLGRAWTTFRQGRLRVLSASEEQAAEGDERRRHGELIGTAVVVGSGRVRLRRVQPAGRAAMDAEAWARGAHPRPGELLGSSPGEGQPAQGA